jgi:hypothetical protein
MARIRKKQSNFRLSPNAHNLLKALAEHSGLSQAQIVEASIAEHAESGHMKKHISISKRDEERAEEIIELRGFDGLSDLIKTLIREEHERRFGVFPNSSPNPLAANTPQK